jgi:hypothetical protein
VYDVNFIGQRIVPESRKKVVAIILGISAITLGLTLASLGSMTLADIRIASAYATEMNRVREGMTERYPGLPTEDELETIIGRTEPHLKDISKIVAGRRTFTPVWESIALAVPEGVWLTSVTVSDPKTSEEEMSGRGRSFKGIAITGVALAGRGPEGDRAVSAFVENLRNDETLQGVVTGVEFLGTGLEQVGGTSVVGFEITCPF